VKMIGQDGDISGGRLSFLEYSLEKSELYCCYDITYKDRRVEREELSQA